MDLDRALRRAQSDGDRILIRRLFDLAGRAERTGYFTFTPFLDEAERAAAESVRAELGIETVFDGGRDGAERTVALLCEDADLLPSREDDAFPVIAIELTHRAPLTHRDILGAVMALGVKREAVGDIIVGGEKSFVLALASVEDFLLSSLREAGRVPLSARICPLGDVPSPEQKYEDIKDTVASVRLDAVLSAAFRIPREAAQSAVKSGLVQVDHRPALSASKELGEGAVLSLRGRGKARLEKIGGQSRKGRVWIEIKRYL